MSFKDELIALNACQEAVDWVGNMTIDQAWDTCVEPEWMFWMLKRTPVTVEREISSDMAFDFIKRVKHLNNIPEITEILANAEKRRKKEDPIARIKGSKELEKLIGKKAPDVSLRPAAQALYQAAETTHLPTTIDPSDDNRLYDEKKILFHAEAAAVQTNHAAMKELMDSVPRKSHDLYAAKNVEIKLEQADIIRKHIPVSKIKQLWVFP